MDSNAAPDVSVDSSITPTPPVPQTDTPVVPTSSWSTPTPTVPSPMPTIPETSPDPVTPPAPSVIPAIPDPMTPAVSDTFAPPVQTDIPSPMQPSPVSDPVSTSPAPEPAVTTAPTEQATTSPAPASVLGEIPSEDRESLYKDLADAMMEALDKGEIEVEDSEASSQFVLDHLDSVQTKADLVNFLKELGERWPIYNTIGMKYITTDADQNKIDSIQDQLTNITN